MTVSNVVESVNEPARHALDAISLSVVVGTLLGYIPIVASVLSIVWLSLQIYTWFEKRYVTWREKRRGK